MIGMFKKDNYLFGSILGVILITVSLSIIYLIMLTLGKSDIFQYYKIYLLALIPNILLMRYYLKVFNYEKTGKALLFVTFILFIAYFYFQFKK